MRQVPTKDETFRNITCESLTIKNFAWRNKVEKSLILRVDISLS